MFGSTAFPRIGELPYLLTLASRGFFWFLLTEEQVAEPEAPAAEEAPEEETREPR